MKFFSYLVFTKRKIDKNSELSKLEFSKFELSTFWTVVNPNLIYKHEKLKNIKLITSWNSLLLSYAVCTDLSFHSSTMEGRYCRKVGGSNWVDLPWKDMTWLLASCLSGSSHGMPSLSRASTRTCLGKNFVVSVVISS